MSRELPYAAMKTAASPGSSDGTWGKTLPHEAFRSAAYFAISFCSEGGGDDEVGAATSDDSAEPAASPTRGSPVLLRWHLPVVGSQSQVWQGALPASDAAAHCAEQRA